MKKYKFKLEALLKMRKLKEEQCKMQIGKIQVRIRELSAFKKDHNEGINQAYVSQEKSLSMGMNGNEIQFHPYFVSGKRAHIDIIDKEVTKLQAHADELYQQLARLRAEVKVIDEMKVEDKKKHKKKIEKKQDAEIEEQVQNWKQIIG